jgi:hypothetical protein
VRIAVVISGIAALGGCVTVKPSERQQLSKPEMSPKADQREDEFHSHISAARNGMMGGHGGAGGGCGCG